MIITLFLILVGGLVFLLVSANNNSIKKIEKIYKDFNSFIAEEDNIEIIERRRIIAINKIIELRQSICLEQDKDKAKDLLDNIRNYEKKY